MLRLDNTLTKWISFFFGPEHRRGAMSVTKSFGVGLEAASWRPRLVLLLWLFNFVLAGVVAFIFAGVFSEAFNGSLTSGFPAARRRPGTSSSNSIATQSGSLGHVFRTLLDDHRDRSLCGPGSFSPAGS